MNKLFWDRLIHFDELIHELKQLPFSSEEQEELIEMIDSTYHHHILEEILSALPKDEHERFMQMLAGRPDDEQILVYLVRFVPDIEARIKNRSLQVREILRSEIQETRTRHIDFS
jgi:hypothetical protein